MSKIKIMLFMLVVLAVGLPVAAQEDDIVTLRYGDVHNGRIADPAEGNLYVFDGNAGDEITIQATSSKIDVYMRLGDSQGNILTENDNISKNNTDSEISYTLPDSDFYYFAVLGYDAGSYSVTLEEVARGSGEEGGETIFISYGDAIDGEAIDMETPVIYGFSGSEGDFVTLYAESEEVDTYLVVIDSEGNVLGENDNANKRDTNALIELELPADGDYYVGVFADDAGEYVLTIEAEGQGGGNNNPVSNNQPLGDVYTGTIDDEYPFSTITLEDVPANTVITVDVQAVSGDLDAYVGIMLDDEVLAENDDRSNGDPNPMLQYRTEEAGTYVIVVTRYDFEDGDTEGDFEATVTVGKASKAAVQFRAGLVNISYTEPVAGVRSVEGGKNEGDWSTFGFSEPDRLGALTQQ